VYVVWLGFSLVFFKIIILYFEIKRWIIARNMDTGRVRKRVDKTGNFGGNQGAVREELEKDLQNTCGGALVSVEHPISTGTGARAVAFDLGVPP
jgi:hypothetical protein